MRNKDEASRQDSRLWPGAALAAAAALIVAGTAWQVGRRMWRNYTRRRDGEQQEIVDEERREARPDGRPAPGDILLFFRPARGRDYVIRWMTRSPFYHAALYAGGGGGNGDPGEVIEARPQGVIRNTLAGRERSYLIVPAPESKGAEALHWAETQLGAGYDRMDPLTILLEHVMTRWHVNYVPYGRYTCAELVGTAFAHAGVRLVPDHGLDGLDPGDIAARFVPNAVSRSL